ncbi:MAG: hypothetical protein ABI835_03925 [Chloroflexota bacterium]
MITSVVFLIEQVATGLYIIIAVALILVGRSWLKAGSAYRGTYFELERDIARYRRGNAFTVLVLLTEFALVIIGIQQVVAPTLRKTMTDLPRQQLSLVSDGEFRTPVPPTFSAAVIDPSNVQLGEIDPAAQIQPTPTLTPTPVGTIVPNAPGAQCPSPDAQLQIPANGMIVFEPIPVVGVATTENFAFYRFELKGESTSGNFATIGVDGTQAIREQGALGQFVPSFYTPGEYQFRVSVFDTTSAVRASCTVTIYISEPIPTPTPLGTASSP